MLNLAAAKIWLCIRQFHLNCIEKWSERSRVKQLLEDFRNSGKWQGESIDAILNRL